MTLNCITLYVTFDKSVCQIKCNVMDLPTEELPTVLQPDVPHYAHGIPAIEVPARVRRPPC